jgi:hypothetical protein
MNILQIINAQMAMMDMPLYAVTLTAVPRADTPLLLMLHWHGFRRDEAPGLPASMAPMHAVPGSALQLNNRWNAMETLEGAMLDAAWQLGAWDVERAQHRGCNYVAANDLEAFECKQAFGDYPLVQDTEMHLLAEAPDRLEMMHLGARVGYVRWKFRPVRGSVWHETAEDDTLLEDGGRKPPCPLKPNIQYDSRNLRISYRLGCVNRIIVP